MKQLMEMHLRMTLVLVLVVMMGETRKVRLYYNRKESKLSSKSVTPTSWVSTKRNATHYVDIPVGMLVGIEHVLGSDYSGKHTLTYDIWVMKGKTNKYAKRCCKEVKHA